MYIHFSISVLLYKRDSTSPKGKVFFLDACSLKLRKKRVEKVSAFGGIHDDSVSRVAS